jgi:two-component system, OmpR family, sensor histidine kinase KdpD
MGEDWEVARGVDDMAGVILRLRRDLATAVGPAEVTGRTLGHVGRAIGVTAVTVHAGDGELARSATVTEPDEAARAELPLDGVEPRPASLLVERAGPEPFSPAEAALLETVAALVSGALERARLFNEVMELERLKTDFIARVSHELRTPLTIVTGFLDTLIAHDAQLEPDQRVHMLDRARSASTRLARLIEELLVLSRMEAGVLTPEIAPVPLDELLDEVRGAAVEPDQVVVVGPPGASIRTDRALLVRALGLLVDNGVKYGGTATVSVRPSEPAGWDIEVRDRGPGFAPDIRATAFEMFTRGTTSTTVPGLGVGLAIARTIVEVLDGTLQIADPPEGPGAVLRIHLR